VKKSRIPDKNDIIILDEVNTCTGNVFLNWSLMKKKAYKGDSHSLNMEVDRLLIDTLHGKNTQRTNIYLHPSGAMGSGQDACRAEDHHRQWLQKNLVTHTSSFQP
jgi:hypothetical protein